MNLYVGTSGYSYKEWKGSFYPVDLPADHMLRCYAKQFNAVEINNTHYRFPRASVLSKWATDVPAGFRFVLKAHKRITHSRRLKEVGDTLTDLLEVTTVLKKRRGPLLFQLPENFRKDVPRLRDFLALLPATTRAAFEFRHESWFDDDVFDALGDHDTALCIAEAEDGVEVPFVSTAKWGYLRLRRPDYRDVDLKKWATRVQQQKWRDAFVFFKHEDEGIGPKLAGRFLKFAER